MSFEAAYYESEKDGLPLLLWAEPLLSKAGDAETEPDERWITLKPNGASHPGYAHVKVKVHPDGTAHILHGPKELRGLRLSKVGSKEDYARRAQERAAAKRAEPKPAAPQETSEVKEARATKVKELEGQRAELHRQATEAAQALTNDPKFELDDKSRADIASGKPHAISSALKRLERQVVHSLTTDPDLKAAILQPGDEVDVQESVPVQATGGRGYQFGTERAAAAQGFTPDDAQAEHEKFLQQRIEGEQDEKKKAQMEGALTRMRERRANPPAPKDRTRSEPIQREALSEKADRARALLKATRAMRAVEAELRRVKLDQDPDSTPAEQEALKGALAAPKGAPWDVSHDTVDEGFAAQLEAQVRDAAAEDLTRSFLGALDEEPGHGWDYTAMRRALQAPHATGAYAHLSNVALATTGGDILDRVVVDTLGSDAAAKLMAHALRRDLPPEQHDQLRAALGGHHDQVSQDRMRAALDDAQAARADAEGMDIPPITSVSDAAVTQQLLVEKREHLRAAHDALGNALGQVEAGAALNLALGRPPEKSLLIPLPGSSIAKAALNLRALGLRDGDYSFHADADGTTWAELHAQGMDRLTPASDPAELETAQRVAGIKRGDEDEADWMPAGFTSYSAAAFNENPPKPLNVAQAPGFGPERDPAAGLQAFVASRLADGWTPGEVSRAVRAVDFQTDWVPEAQRGAYLNALDQLLPPTELGSGAYVDYDHLDAKHPELAARLESLANDHLQATHPGEVPYAAQQLQDTPQTRKAVYMALLEDPKAQLGYKPASELTPQDGRAIRSYFLTSVAGLSAEALARRSTAGEDALREYDEKYPEPDKFAQASTQASMFDMLGDAPAQDAPITLTPKVDPADRERALRRMGLTEPGEHYSENADGSVTLTPAGQKALQPPPADVPVDGLERLNSDWTGWNQRRAEHVAEQTQDDLPEWKDFAETLKGPRKAYDAVQEHMRGAFNARYARYHAAVTGTPLRTSKRVHAHGEALWSVGDRDGHQVFRQAMQAMQGNLRERQGGKFSGMGGKGALVEAFRTYREQQKAAQNNQGALFGSTADEHRDAPAPIPHMEGVALPRGVESRLGEMLQHVTGNITPDMNPVKLIPDMTMGKGTKFVKQQRAIKTILAGKKVASWLGVGSGKTGVSIGAFTQLHHEGKARKGIFAVPSIVRSQFGEEMARVTEPGKYRWHAKDDTFEGRLKAYQDPETQMISVTHQSYRDDMTRLMGDHHGLSETEVTQRFMAATPAERTAMLKEALDGHGIPHDYFAMDEAHDSLNRAGKGESMLSAIVDSAMSLSNYGTLMTGSPLKNDASEVFDTLKKVDPERFADQDALRRKYGTDVFAAQEGLKRLLDRYTYADAVPSGTTKKVVWGQEGQAGDTASGHAPIALTPWQHAEIARADDAFDRARRARRADRVDVDAMKVLSPNSFEGAPEEEHEDIARNLQRSAGALRFGAHSRAINDAPPEHNAKIQHIVQLAGQRRGKGGVVFAHSRAAVEHTRAALEGAGHKVALITGSSSADDKAKAREAFNRGDVDIVLCSDAGATGANLQGRGEWLANVDLPLTQKTLEQRNARIDRLGQKRPIELHNLISDAAHDKDNYRRLERKRALGALFQGEHEDLDDTGLGRHLVLAGLGRPAPAPEAQGGLF